MKIELPGLCWLLVHGFYTNLVDDVTNEPIEPSPLCYEIQSLGIDPSNLKHFGRNYTLELSREQAAELTTAVRAQHLQLSMNPENMNGRSCEAMRQAAEYLTQLVPEAAQVKVQWEKGILQ